MSKCHTISCDIKMQGCLAPLLRIWNEAEWWTRYRGSELLILWKSGSKEIQRRKDPEYDLSLGHILNDLPLPNKASYSTVFTTFIESIKLWVHHWLGYWLRSLVPTHEHCTGDPIFNMWAFWGHFILLYSDHNILSLTPSLCSYYWGEYILTKFEYHGVLKFLEFEI